MSQFERGAPPDLIDVRDRVDNRFRERQELLGLNAPGVAVTPAFTDDTPQLLARALGATVNTLDTVARVSIANSEEIKSQVRGTIARDTANQWPVILDEISKAAPIGDDEDPVAAARAYIGQKFNADSEVAKEALDSALTDKVAAAFIARRNQVAEIHREESNAAHIDAIAVAKTPEEIAQSFNSLVRNNPDNSERRLKEASIVPALQAAAITGDRGRVEMLATALGDAAPIERAQAMARLEQEETQRRTTELGQTAKDLTALLTDVRDGVAKPEELERQARAAGEKFDAPDLAERFLSEVRGMKADEEGDRVAATLEAAQAAAIEGNTSRFELAVAQLPPGTRPDDVTRLRLQLQASIDGKREDAAGGVAEQVSGMLLDGEFEAATLLVQSSRPTIGDTNTLRQMERIATAQRQAIDGEFRANAITQVGQIMDRAVQGSGTPAAALPDEMKPYIEAARDQRLNAIADNPDLTPQQKFQAQVDFLSSNGLEHPQWEGILSVGQSGIDTDLNVSPAAVEAYGLFQQLRAANPDLLARHANDETIAFYRLAEAVEGGAGRTDPERALRQAASIMREREERTFRAPAGTPRPSASDLESDASDVTSGAINRAQAEFVLGELAEQYAVLSNMGEKAARKAAKKQFREDYRVIDGVLSRTAGQVLPQHIEKTSRFIAEAFASEHPELGYAANTLGIQFRAGSWVLVDRSSQFIVEDSPVYSPRDLFAVDGRRQGEEFDRRREIIQEETEERALRDLRMGWRPGLK